MIPPKMFEPEAAVLVVDDDPDIRDAIVEMLEVKGYRVLTAENGLDALEQLGQLEQLPWLILLDQMMPVMDGHALLAKLKEQPRLSPIPVVLLSGNHDLPGAITAGAVALLHKPFELKGLLALVIAQQHRLEKLRQP